MALLRVRRGGRGTQVRVLGDFVRQIAESAWMGRAGKDGTCSQVRVLSGFVCQKPESAWICAGDAEPCDRASIHFRRFGTRGRLLPARKGPPPALSARASMHFRRFGARWQQAPALQGAPRTPERSVPRTSVGRRAPEGSGALRTPRRSGSHLAPHRTPPASLAARTCVRSPRSDSAPRAACTRSARAAGHPPPAPKSPHTPAISALVRCPRPASSGTPFAPASPARAAGHRPPAPSAANFSPARAIHPL